MLEIDYKKIGFKSGLEIHQQLDSHKLFCDCPSLLRKDEPDFEVSRKLHAVAGEGGEVDVAAKHEAELGKEFIYQCYDTTCLVELDEEPPHQINKDALQTALHISFFLNCEIQPITQIMRKTVIDGSNTSGFQRTLLVARDGFIETSKGKVGIWFIYLEEDAARTVGEKDGKKIYRLDRLGFPMVEIVTAPDIKDAEHAKEVALKIGGLIRSAKVKRGIGTIRQDVNISVKGHPRTETKGFQDPKMMVKTVEIEIQRQLENLRKNKELKPEVRNAQPDGTTKFLRPLPGSARMYPETDLPLLKISRDFINKAKKNLPKLKSVQEEELKGKGLNEDMVRLLFKQNKVEEFKELLDIINKPQLIAKVLLMFPKEIAKREKIELKKVEEKLEDHYSRVLELFKKKKISESQIKDALRKIILDEELVFEKVSVGDIEDNIRKLIKSKPGLNANAYMGLVMKEFGGKVGGKEAMEIIKKHLN